MPISTGIGLAAGALGSVAQGAIGAYGAKSAANTTAAAAQQQTDFLKQVYAHNQNLAQPFIKTGQNATYSLAGMYGLPTPGNPHGGGSAVNDAFNAFTNLPSYKFPFEQGERALTFNLNAQGLNASGAQLREATQFGQGLASQYLGQYLGGLSGLANTGASSAGALAGVNTTLGQGIGNTILGQGTANAAGTVGATNAIGGGIGAAGNNLMLYSLLAKSGGGAGGAGSSAPQSLASSSYQPLGGVNYAGTNQSYGQPGNLGYYG